MFGFVITNSNQDKSECYDNSNCCRETFFEILNEIDSLI